MTTTKTEALDLLRLMQSLYEADLMETAPEWALSLRKTIADMEATHPAPTQPDAQGLPELLTDEDFVQIEEAAQASFLRHQTSVRGQMVTSADVYEFHLMRATEARVRQSIAQATQQAAGQAGEVVAYACPDELELMKQRTVKHCLLSTFPAHGGKDVALYTRPAAVPDGWQDVIERMVKGIDHLAELARQWEPDHSSGADRRGWVLAKDARDDALRLLQTAKPSNAAVPEWQPIETAPKDGTDMALLFARDDFVLGQAYSRVRCGSFVAGKDWGFPYHRDNPPTHWMPLPPAPLQAAKGAV